jgi:hypothetical protein
MYIALLVLASLAAGFALSSFYYSSSTPDTRVYTSASSMIRVVQAYKQDDYYVNVLSYSDSIHVTAVDTLCARPGSRIAGNYSKGVFTLIAERGAIIDSVPATTFAPTSYTLVDSTIYSSYGVMYGSDLKGVQHSFPISDVTYISYGGGVGTVTVGVVSIELFD